MGFDAAAVKVESVDCVRQHLAAMLKEFTLSESLSAKPASRHWLFERPLPRGAFRSGEAWLIAGRQKTLLHLITTLATTVRNG